MCSTDTALSPTTEQLSFAAGYLASTCDELKRAVMDLTETQASFRREPDEWSIAQVVEHLAIIEGRIHAVVSRLHEAAAAEPGRKDAEIDRFIIENIPRRTSRVQAPEVIQPKGECTLCEALKVFVDKRQGTIEMVKNTTHLRGRILPHPIHGPWDGYQWILAAGAHTARHVAQIRETQSAQTFPLCSAGQEV